jgi:leader peptidase (prepilin peptidase)/N-methyltransferase
MQTLAEVGAAFPWLFPSFVFVFGAAIGSFLNVCICRIPAGRSVVTPGSTCACGRPIAWHDNVPILSWLLLRGRARCCGRPFSIRYPAVELLTALLFLGCWLRATPAAAAASMVLAACLVCAAFIDLDTMEIPNRFSVGAAVAGVVLSALAPTLHGFKTDIATTALSLFASDAGGSTLVLFVIEALRSTITSIVGVLVGSGVVLWIGLMGEAVLRKDAMGFGDVKLLGAIGAFLGWQGGVFAIFGGAVLGTFALGLVWLWHTAGGRRPAETADAPSAPGAPATTAAEAPAADAPGGSPVAFGREVPFGPMLAAAALIYLLWLGPRVDAYFAEIAAILFGAL